MSKRGPTSELNHDNWDQEDSEDEDVKGGFQQAAPEEMQKRVIRVAKRRSVNTNSPANSPFSTFKGFQTVKAASPATPSFDFVGGGLKNGHAKENEMIKEETKTPINSSVQAQQNESSKPSTSKDVLNSVSSPKAGTKRSKSGSIEDEVGSPDYYAHLKSLNLSVASWINKHLDDNPFCILTPVFKDYERHLENINKKNHSKVTEKEEDTPEIITSVETKASPVKALEVSKTSTKIFPSITQSDSSPEFKEKPALPSTGSIFSKITSSPSSTSSSSSLMFTLPESSSNDSPISTDSGKLSSVSDKSPASDVTSAATPAAEFSTPALQTPAPSASPSVFQTPALTTPSLFGSGNVFGGTKPTGDNKTFNPSSLTFSFGAAAAASASDKTSTVPTFGISAPSFGGGTTSAPAFGSTTTSSSSGFSFGSSNPPVFGKNTGSIFGNGPPAGGFGNSGMSFGSLAATTLRTQTENKETEEENEEPPKVEFNPIKEENAVYETICKVYVLKDGEYKDRGKGQLYIKKAEGGKSQLLARAATTTGQILLNVLLNPSVPTSRPATGKNSVLIMCIPTPSDEKPTAVLVRVKSDADADTLLAKLEEHKKSMGEAEKKD